MDGMRVVVTLHGHGTLAANMVAHYKMPCDMTLVQVDAVATTAAVGSLDIGTDVDPDGYLDGVTPGASNVPATFDRGDFNGALNPDTAECVHLAKGTVLIVTVTHNSMINPDVALTFLEG
jgi:phage tail sheath gpL-like